MKIKIRKSVKKDIKKVLLIALFIATPFNLYHNLKPTGLFADYDRHNFLPKSGERIMSVEEKIRYIAMQENFKWPDYLVRLANCESRLNPKARNDNGKYGIDRGTFQINNKYHPTITDEQADDIDFATRWTINKINLGQQHLWACDRIITKK